MKFRPPEVPKIPAPGQWKWWKKVFTDGLVINKITDDGHKLTFLRSYAGADLYPLLQTTATFAEAGKILSDQFGKSTRTIFARHKLLSSKQKDEESIPDFIKRLKLLVEECECQDVTAAHHRNLLSRDSLVSGLRSDLVRAMLLELDNTKSVDDCFALANAIDLSLDYSKSYQSTSRSDCLAAFTHETVAAFGNPQVLRSPARYMRHLSVLSVDHPIIHV